MYEERVKDLREKAEFLTVADPLNIKNAFAETMQQAADAIEELSRENESLAKSVNEASEILRKRWIPVTERLPREQESVLVWGSKLGAILLDWRHDNKWCCFRDVTHWMPLPTPPKGEEDGSD